MLVEEITKINQHIEVIVKVIIPAIIGVGIKLAVEMKKKGTRISFLNGFVSFFIGVGGAWICKDLVQNTFPEDYVPVAFAFIAIMADKIAEYLIYEFKIDLFVINLIENIFKSKKQ